MSNDLVFWKKYEMKFQDFKIKYPVLFWRSDNLSEEEILINIIQLENKKALKDLIKQIWFEKTKTLFFKIRRYFEWNPDMKLRYQRMYNRFIFYKKKEKGLIKDMRKFKFWRSRRI